MIVDNNANITLSQKTDTFGAVFCPKDEKKMTPIAIGTKYGQTRNPN
jgi:hypothetical protein